MHQFNSEEMLRKEHKCPECGHTMTIGYSDDDVYIFCCSKCHATVEVHIGSSEWDEPVVSEEKVIPTRTCPVCGSELKFKSNELASDCYDKSLDFDNDYIVTTAECPCCSSEIVLHHPTRMKDIDI